MLGAAMALMLFGGAAGCGDDEDSGDATTTSGDATATSGEAPATATEVPTTTEEAGKGGGGTTTTLTPESGGGGGGGAGPTPKQKAVVECIKNSGGDMAEIQACAQKFE
jgi:hypothetical protein